MELILDAVIAFGLVALLLLVIAFRTQLDLLKKEEQAQSKSEVKPGAKT
jgi:hypothetical protein